MCVLGSHRGIHLLRRSEPSESGLFPKLFKSPSMKLWETSHIQVTVLTWTFLSSLPYPLYTIKSARGKNTHTKLGTPGDGPHFYNHHSNHSDSDNLKQHDPHGWPSRLHFIQPTELYPIISLRTMGIKAKRGLGTFPRLSRWGSENLDLELRHLIPRFVFLAKTGDQ